MELVVKSDMESVMESVVDLAMEPVWLQSQQWSQMWSWP